MIELDDATVQAIREGALPGVINSADIPRGDRPCCCRSRRTGASSTARAIASALYLFARSAPGYAQPDAALFRSCQCGQRGLFVLEVALRLREPLAPIAR